LITTLGASFLLLPGAPLLPLEAEVVLTLLTEFMYDECCIVSMAVKGFPSSSPNKREGRQIVNQD